MHQDVAIIIPARLASTRLQGKMLLQIGDRSLVEQTYQRALEAEIGTIYVATDSEEIGSLIAKRGGQYIMTDQNCPSGSDRVLEALKQLPDSRSIKYVINIQGDMPFLDATVVREVINKLKSTQYDIVTPLTRVGIDIASSTANVKAVVDLNDRAMYFSRSLVPHNAEDYFYHIGIYGFRIEALKKFVQLPRGKLEVLESLEQLRALESGMSIGVCYTDSIPISVDTQQDLEKARAEYIKRIK